MGNEVPCLGLNTELLVNLGFKNKKLHFLNKILENPAHKHLKFA